MAKRKIEARRQSAPADSVADQIADFIGKSMGGLMNRRDALMREVAGIDEQVAAVTKGLTAQIGRYLPAEVRLPRVLRGRRPGSSKLDRTVKAGKTGSKRQRGRGFTPEQRAEAAERMRKYWADRKKKEARGR